MMHLQRSSKCAHWAQMNNAATVSQNIVIAAAKTNDTDNSLNESNANGELVDNLSISNTDHDLYVLDTHEFAVWILDLPCQAICPKEIQNPQMINTSISAE